MDAETKPSCGTAAAQFHVDEAYEYRAPKYFDFVTDETEDDVRAAERWFEASASHAPSPFAPRIKESRKEVKIDALCDFADAEELGTTKKEAIEGARGITIPPGHADGNSQERKDGSFGFVSGANHSGSIANSSNQQHEESVAACADAMSESPPLEEVEESPKSFEFPQFKDLASKRGLHYFLGNAASNGESSTPKIQRPSPPTEVFSAAPTCVNPMVKTKVCTPMVQANTSTGCLQALTSSKVVQPSALKQSSMTVRRSVIKGLTRNSATAVNVIAQEN